MKVKQLDLVAQYESIKEEVDRAVAEVFSTQYFILGPKVEELERTIASYCGTAHAVGVASGSDALMLSLMALDIGPGDEVITTPYTFFSTASSITRLGATPVMVDIDPRTFNIDPVLVERALTPRTRAILVVHLFGQTADMDPILSAAGRAGVPVIEDACQSIGATHNGRKAGSMGKAGCFSFFPSKNLGGCGDGGMVVTDDDALAERVRLLRVHGGRQRYYHDVVGVNSRLDALQAAVLLVKMKHLDRWNEARRENAREYDAALSTLAEVTTPHVAESNVSIFNQYVIRAASRDGLKSFLQRNGIGCEIYYPVPLHLQACFAFLGGRKGDLPESEKAAEAALALPIYPELGKEALAHVTDKVRRFYGREDDS